MSKRFILTEEEKKHILNLYEKIGDKLSPQALQSSKSKDTKDVATFLNSYYKIKLPSALTGSWTDKDYNDTLKKFMEEKGIPVWICKKGDGYCHDDSEGEVGTKDIQKLKRAMQLSSEGGDKINTTNDRTYDYKLSNGKYYYSLKGKNKWVEAKGKALNAIKTKVKF